MAVTDEQSRLNARTASRNVARVLGLDPLNLTPAERDVYNRALANEILRYPQSFTDLHLRMAREYQEDPLQDASFDFGALLENTGLNVAPVLTGFTNKLLWILAAAVLLWVFLNSRPPGASTARARA